MNKWLDGDVHNILHINLRKIYGNNSLKLVRYN